MKIKQIFDEIAAESSTKLKQEILTKYKDNETLKRVLYLANSKRVKYYIKQIPDYTRLESHTQTIESAIEALSLISDRKVTGHEASQHLAEILATTESDDAYIIERIIEKDCKIGMGTTYMNKVFKDLIEDTPYMGAVSFDEKKAREIFKGGKKGLSQIKMDGRYCNAIIRNGEVELESRQGEPTLLKGAIILDELGKFGDCVLNGELTMDGVPRYESNGIIASLIDIIGKRSERTQKENASKLAAFENKHGNIEEWLRKIRYTVWDTITVEEYFEKKSKTPYHKRLENVRKLISDAKATMVREIESKEVNSYAEAMEHFQEVLATEVDGVPQEGTILKAYDGEWKDGKPTWQIKLKIEMNVDLKIVGFNYGTKGTKNENVISSLVCESSDGLLVTQPQGLKEADMKYITDNKDKLLGSIIEVKCSGLSNDSTGAHSLMYPAFKGFRDDKNIADSLNDIIANEKMIKGVTV